MWGELFIKEMGCFFFLRIFAPFNEYFSLYEMLIHSAMIDRNVPIPRIFAGGIFRFDAEGGGDSTLLPRLSVAALNGREL